MAKRISVTPGVRLRLVPSRWQSKFASEAAEILIREGRSSEVLQSITGLTLADLTGEFLTLGETGKNKKKHCQKDKQANTTCSSSFLSSQNPDMPLENNSLQRSTSENQLSTVSSDEMTNGIIEIQAELF